MKKLIFRDIRCFRGQSSARLAPITILVGENSTGKSSLLALTRVAWDIAYGLTGPNFNEEPFQLGAYDELAHYHGGQGKRARTFSVGFEDNLRQGRQTGPIVPTSVIGTFSSIAGQPALTKLVIGSGKWILAADAKKDQVSIHIQTPKREYDLTSTSEYAVDSLTAPSLSIAFDYFASSVRRIGHQADIFEGTPPDQEELETLTNILAPFRRFRILGRRGPQDLGRPIASAPIRTKPKRTYDPLRENRSPEGDHVPMQLARLSATEPAEWSRIKDSLSEYGKRAGLFQEINIKRFGDKASPFQVTVKLVGQRHDANLMDVGYGVSQVLPILVDCLTERRNGFFLMQQPEVHLHPRAQAQLGSFIVDLCKSKGHKFLIETHSDYLVDRMRSEIREGKIAYDQVALVFLERSESAVDLHEIGFDKAGTPSGQPERYRQFFLQEELRTLGVA